MSKFLFVFACDKAKLVFKIEKQNIFYLNFHILMCEFTIL